MERNKRRRVLIVGADGLRPDQFDPDVMPTYARMMQQGTRLSQYHAVFPTHTRVNISTLATGTVPAHHGVVANVMRVPGSTADGIINTSDYRHLAALDQATEGNAVLRPTIGEMIAARGKRLAISATSSGGAGILWNRKHPYRVVNTNTAYGRAELYSLRDKLGEVPEPETPPKKRHLDYAARAVTDIFIDDDEVEVIVFWMSEPDSALHYFGLGSPEVTEAMRACDDALAHVLDTMDERGIRDQFNILLVSDHGHSTVLARRSLAEHIDNARRMIGSNVPELTTASDYIYAAPGQPVPDAEALRPLVEWLQDQPFTGALFGGTAEITQLPGVLPLKSMWNGQTSQRAPLLSVSPAWSANPNANGVPGLVAALTEHAALKSTHGSASPFELHAFATGVGPDFKEGHISALPAGAQDLAPTVLSLLGMDVPPSMDGRILQEMLLDQSEAPSIARDEVIEPEVPHGGGFTPELHLHTVGRSQYVHQVTNGRGAGFDE